MKIIDDTLKTPSGKWSRTSLTMFVSFVIANVMALYDAVKKGFNFEVFMVYIGVATGMKVIDIIGKKINPDTINPTPNDKADAQQ